VVTEVEAGVEKAPSELRRAIGADFAYSTWLRRLALVGVCCWLAYEWGPGNEAVTPWLLVSVLGRTDGALAILVTAAVGFAFTTLQQLASGCTALLGFSMFERTAHASWRLLHRRQSELPEWSQLGWPSRAVLVFGLGTTAVALIQIMTTGQAGVRPHRRTITMSALLCGALVGTIGALIASLVVLAQRIPALAEPTEWLLRILGNPLLWLSLVAAVLVVPVIRSRRTSKLADDRLA
jgi:hypothetical protein